MPEVFLASFCKRCLSPDLQAFLLFEYFEIDVSVLPGKLPRQKSRQQLKQRIYEQCGQLLWRSTIEVLQLLLCQKSCHAKDRQQKTIS